MSLDATNIALNNPDMEEALGATHQAAEDANAAISQLQLDTQQNTNQITGPIPSTQIVGVIPYTQIGGLGGLAILNPGTPVAANATVISAAYVQAEAVSVQATLNALIASLTTAGII